MTQELSLGMKALDKFDLQNKLKAFRYLISATEFERKFFDKPTRETVLIYRGRHDLPVTGIVGANSVKLNTNQAIHASPSCINLIGCKHIEVLQ